ncbi:MAG TPA: hypothetical protein VMS01_15335 [Stellaceae bacterium]|nr:hypothetical protein [Stellaceae bacterium]
MRYRKDKALLSTAAAAMLLLGCAWPLAATAASVNSADGPIACNDFQRGSNGTWTVLHPTTIAPQGVALSLAPGQTFAKNQWLGGIEVTTVLDRNCGNE